MKPTSLLGLLLVLSTAASAQSITVRPLTFPVAGAGKAPSDTPQTVHITDVLHNSPEGREQLRQFHARKAAGWRPAAKGTAYQVGAVQSFNVLQNLMTTASWTTKSFTLKASSDIANIWVEDGELGNGNVNDGDVAFLQTALLERTDQGPYPSYDPNMGIIAIDNAIFGDPPNVDGDGKVDILLYDITEGSTGQGFILGYVTPADLCVGAGCDGNQADVLYLDTDPTITSPNSFSQGENTILATAMHEYQHLIHNNYEPGELTFVNEGLSEWAELQGGYQGRSITYVTNPSNHNLELLGWDTAAGLFGDYQRAGLFTTYIGDQLGTPVTGTITQNQSTGATGLTAVFTANGTTMKDIVGDFHTALFVNNTALDPRFGFTSPQRQGLKTVPTLTRDGQAATETATSQFTLSSGGVQYLSWTDVSSFALTFDAVDTSPVVDLATFRARLQARAILEHSSGLLEVVEVDPGENPTFTGTFSRLTLMVAHAEPGQSGVVVTYAAEWNQDTGNTAIEDVIYDDGNVVVTSQTGNQLTIEAYSLGSTGGFANKFSGFEGATLQSVSLAPFYESDFGNGSGTHDFRLHVWADDGNGEPGTELLGLDVIDSRSGSSAPEYTFHTVDLRAYQAELANLPDPVYIGLTNIGTDTNYLIMGVSEYTGNTSEADAVSFLTLPPNIEGWAPFHLITSDGESILLNRVLPIRASFLVSVGTDDEGAEVPQAITLAANYPNPFNPTTTIGYTLNQATEVSLRVYDVLGRAVATLTQGLQPAGRYEVPFDASHLSSGVYLYRLEAAGQHLTRSMLLVK
jgi:hypothetical protein